MVLTCSAAAAAALVVSCTDAPKSPVAPNVGTAPHVSGAVVDAYDGGQIHGAIFTTTPNGGTVNANVQYTDKRQVYLDGGPKGNAPITAAGLPDGLYVFQITDPPGKVLLSDDPSKCRVVQVAGGVIKQLVAPADLPAPYGPLSNYFGNGNPGTPCSIQDSPDGVAGASGRHDTNHDVDHWSDAQAIVVQMMPFLDTPNPGGVYKAWMTPLAVYVAKGGALNAQTSATKVQGKVVGYARDPGFAPPLNKVKTDNFKVTQNPPFVQIDKLVDANRDGLSTGDASYAVPPGWPVTVTETVDGGTVTNEYFTPTGNIGVPQNSTVMVCERVLSTWYFSYVYVNGVKTTPLSSPTADGNGDPIKCVNATVGTNNTVLVAFGNYQLPNLEIAKSPATQTVVSGDPINWTVTVSNTGLGAAFGVYITDQLQAVTGGTYSTSTAGCSINGSLLLSCNVGTLAGGASFSAAIRLQTSSGEFCGTVTNTAKAGGTGLSEITSNTVSATVTGCGRMTGGSGQVQITDDTFLTSGFTIHCDIVLSNNIEINWPNNKWHITKPITYARCVDDPAVTPGQPDAPFDTFIGRAVGELNGVAGSTVEFTFVDAGEPGKIADRASILIKDKFGTTVLNISNVPIKGNLQAHEDQPHN